MAADRVIFVSNLSKRFGNRVVLNAISFELLPGTALGLVGLNGAGKTTLIRILLGLLKPENPGTVSVLGFDPWRHSAALFWRIGVVLEHDGFEGNLNLRTNLGFFGAAKGMRPQEIDAYCRDYWGDAAIFLDRKPVKHFSRGQRMQCALCRAFLNWPSVMLLDEPTVALDIEAYDRFCRLVREAVRRGAAVIISSHVLETIEELCGSVAVLHEGELSVRSLTKSNGDEREIWSIGGDEDLRYAPVIAEAAGSAPIYEAGEWRFSISKPETAIPLLVQRLTEAGLAIRHVARKSLRLREMLQRRWKATT